MKAVSLTLALLLGCCSVAGAQHFAAFVQRYGPEQGLASEQQQNKRTKARLTAFKS